MSPYLISWIVLYVVVIATPFLPFMQNNIYVGPLYMIVLSAAAWLLLFAQSRKDLDEYRSGSQGPASSSRPRSTS